MNVIIYTFNPVNVSYSATNTDNNYPLSNLNSFYEKDIWKSANNNNNQVLILDTINTQPGKDYAIVRGSNILIMLQEGMGEVKLQCALDANFTNGLTTVYDYKTQGFNEIIRFTAYGRRYWRILFQNTQGYIPQVANFWIGTAYDLGDVYSYPFQEIIPEYKTHTNITLDGRIKKSQIYNGYHNTWNLTFKNINTDTQLKLREIYNRQRGSLIPFYFSDAEGRLHYVRFDDDNLPIEITKPGQYADINIKLRSIEL